MMGDTIITLQFSEFMFRLLIAAVIGGIFGYAIGWVRR
jgi:hypothetical protein